MMKIPLEHEPFLPMALSRCQEEQLEWLSDALLEETLAENDEFVFRDHRVLDKTKWKSVIARDNISIYKRTGPGELGGTTPHVDLHEPHSEPRSRHWRLPLCVGVGTLTGSLDDLLYGQLAPTKVDTQVRSSYTKDDGADTRVLATIVRPTEREPLRLLVVRWMLLRQFVHNLGVSPRDVVYMESMGTRTLPNGERIGYIVTQSVDPPGCSELTPLGLVRAAFTSCYLLRDAGHGTVEVYMRAHMDPGGKMPDGVAVFSACMALISIWRLMLAGQNKKLAFLVRTKAHQRDSTPRGKTGDELKMCRLCLKSIAGLRSRASCDLCHATLCARCVDKRKLTHVRPDESLVRVPTQICKGCLSTAARMDAGDVAASEHVANSSRTIRFYSHDTASSSSVSSHPRQSPHSLVSGSWRPSTDTISSDSTMNASGEGFYGSLMSDLSLAESEFSLPSPPPTMERSSREMDGDDEATLSVDRAHFEMWARVNRLRVAKDEAEMLTSQRGADFGEVKE